MTTCKLAQHMLARFRAAGKTLATAESCTGGLIGKSITDIPGCSDVYLGGVIAYANSVKTSFFGVSEETLTCVGAVSEEVARAMAEGVRASLGADVSVGVTGLAGPGADGSDKPVGLVYFAVASAVGTTCRELRLNGGRSTIRKKTCREILKTLTEL